MNDKVDLQSESGGSFVVVESTADASDIQREVQESYPVAKIHTGKIESTFLYKRIFKSSGQHSHDQDTSYWWLTIKTFDGELVSYNIHSENKRVDTLKKGDVISFIISEGVSLRHPLKIKKDKEIVKHNEIATTVVFHRKDDSFYIIDSYLKPECKDTGALFGQSLIAIFIIAALDLFVLQEGGVGNVILETAGKLMNTRDVGSAFSILSAFWACIWIAVSMVIDKRNKAKFSKDLALYESLETASQKLMALYFNPPSVSASPLLAEDGAITSVPVDEVMSDENIEHSSQSNDTDVFRQFQQFNSQWTDEFIYRHVLAPNEKGTMHYKTFLAKVVNKDISVTASKKRSSHTERTTTSYKNKYGTTLRQEHNDRDVSHTIRTSTIKGSIEIFTADHDSLEVNLPTDALRSIDVGDWLLLGEGHGEIAGSQYKTNELTYNISKNIKTEGASLSEFGSISTMSSVIMGAVFIGCLALDIQSNFHDRYLTFLFIPFLVAALGLSVLNTIRNTMSKKSVLKEFKLAHQSCLKNRTDILIAAE